MPAKNNQVVLDKTTYNFSISDDRVWFEDDVSKHQWEWKSPVPEPQTTKGDVPLDVLLCVAEKACKTGIGRTAATKVSIEDAKSPGDLKLLVSTILGCDGYDVLVSRTLVLKTVPLTSEQMAEAKHADMREQLQELKQLVANMNAHTRKLELQISNGKAQIAKLQKEAAKPWWQTLWEWVRRVVSSSIDYAKQAFTAAKNAAVAA